MKKKRLIPVLLLKNGQIVQSKGFNRFQTIGNPVTAVERLSQWASDELIYLDITRDGDYDLGRDDLAAANRRDLYSIIEDVSRAAFMPIVFGGRIRSLEEIAKRLSHGADKVSVNTAALERPAFIGEAAREFGSQCVIVSIDAKTAPRGAGHRVWTRGGTLETKYEPAEWAKIAESEGAGEILLNSIDRDGSREGFDLALVDRVARAVKIPVIALGGAGEWEHFSDVFAKTGADAAAAANIFHFVDQSVYLAKKHLSENGHNVRKPELMR